jgi:5-formyltetrahydrofolate cyclo-ligase
MNKKELRKIFVAKRNGLTKGEVQIKSRHICDKFFTSIDLSSIKVLHIFLPIEKNNEPDTQLIIDGVRKDFPHIRITVPRINQQTGLLENVYITQDHLFKKNAWDINEPIEGTITDPGDIDLIVIPLLTFDNQGNRVGYGKGFYDKFLAYCRPDAKRVGISLFDGVERIDDVDGTDQRLHYCITPYRVIEF